MDQRWYTMGGYCTKTWIQGNRNDWEIILETGYPQSAFCPLMFHFFPTCKIYSPLPRPPKVSYPRWGTARWSFLEALLLNWKVLWGITLNLHEVFAEDCIVSFIFIYFMFSFECLGFYLIPEAIPNFNIICHLKRPGIFKPNDSWGPFV